MKYNVTIRAKITKMFTIEAEDEDAAMAQANEMFDIDLTGDERYEQFVLNITEG